MRYDRKRISGQRAKAHLFSSDRNVDYFDILHWLFLVYLGTLNPVNDVHALECATEDSVLLIQPGHLFRCCGDEELGC